MKKFVFSVLQKNMPTLNLYTHLDLPKIHLKEAQAGQDKALASLKSFEALISKHKDSMIQSKKLLEKHTHQWTDAKKSLTEPLQSRKQAEERVALHTKQLQRWQAEQINTKRHLELLALQEMQTDLEFLNEELEEAKNIFSTALAKRASSLPQSVPVRAKRACTS